MDRYLQTGPFNMRAIFLSALLLASMAFAEGPVAPATSDSLMVKSVRVLGTKSAVDLKTQVGQIFDSTVVQSDVHHLWATGRFDDIRVETTPVDEGTGVVFHVVEMPQLVLHTFHVEPSTFGLQMSLPEGTPMSRLRAHQIANQAQQDLRSDGFRTATVDYDLVPFIGNKVDLHLNIDAGERIRVKQVEFSGDTEFDSKDLHGALRSLKIRRVTPPIPGIWAGWHLYPGYNPDGVEGDLALLRSYYLSRGYFDATVKLNDVQVAQKAARVNIQVQAGQMYHVPTWQVSGNGVIPKVVHPLNNLMRYQNFCSTLFVARREAEHDGILDFTVNLQVQPTAASTPDAPEANLAATVDRGNPFHIGRIEFTGNRHFSEAAVRSNFLLDEGDLLDEHLLRKSMARLNEANFFAPINEHTTIIHTDPKTGIADIDIRVTERKRGAWNLSGPVGPASIAGPLEASIHTRLPAWGSGMLEASTYTVSFTMFAFVHSFLPVLGLPKIPFVPIAALNRPYSPGAGWKSGFMIIPQLGWQYMALGYGVSQLQHRLLPVLQGDRGLEPELPVTVETPNSQTTMFCEPPAPRYAPARSALAMGLRFIGSVAGF
ncbi:MAG TPA: POTRA domain-containing protein [Bryobacteraceae bacterium]|nr:POTRA domain-containing protein [Bryobacteraceae bacterium]